MSDNDSRNCLWQDRKRFLSMPVCSVHYAVTDQYISITEGYIRINNYNIALTRICNVKCRCGLRQRFANQGNVIITWRSDQIMTTVIENVRAPLMVKDLILRLSEEAKARRRFRGGHWPALSGDYFAEAEDLFSLH